MANSYLQQFRYSYEKYVVDAFANVTIGTTGAPTLNTSLLQSSKGVKSITRTGVGKYSVVLKDNFIKLLNVDATVQNATGIAASPTIGIVTTGTNVTTLSGGTLVIQFSAAGTATELASGDIVYLQMTLSNSSSY